MKKIIMLCLLMTALGLSQTFYESTNRGTEIDSSVDGTFGTKNVTASNGIFNSLWANNLSSGVFYGIYSTAATNSAAFGYSALQYNTQVQSSAFGYQTGRENTGAKFAGFGYTTGQYNTGESFAGLGYDCGRHNTGEFVSLLGGYSGWRQNGDSVVGVGYESMENNFGDQSTGIGVGTLKYNQGEFNTALGSGAFNTFTVDATTDKTFGYTNILLADNKIALASHGYTGYINLKYTQGTSTISGLTSGYIYNFKVDDADTLILIYPTLTAVGTGTGHTLTASTQRTITNSTAIGYNSEPTASNQIVLGNGSVTSVLAGQSGTSALTAGAITGNGNLSIKPNGTNERFAVLDAYATLQAVDFTRGTSFTTIYRGSSTNPNIQLNNASDYNYASMIETGSTGKSWYLDVRSYPAGVDGHFRIGDTGTNGEYTVIDSVGKITSPYGLNYAADTSSSDAYDIVLPGALTLVAGLEVTFKVNTANTDGATLTINSLTATALTKVASGSVATALATGDIIAGQIVKAVYDGTQFQVISRLAQ